MKYFVCLQSNSVCRAGQYLASEADGEDFWLVRLEQTDSRNKWKAVVTNPIQIPFRSLCDHVAPLGFSVPMSMANQRPPSEQATAQEIEGFIRGTDEIYAEEKLRRDKASDPTHTGRTE